MAFIATEFEHLVARAQANTDVASSMANVLHGLSMKIDMAKSDKISLALLAKNLRAAAPMLARSVIMNTPLDKKLK
jgi:hypothetical protein